MEKHRQGRRIHYELRSAVCRAVCLLWTGSILHEDTEYAVRPTCVANAIWCAGWCEVCGRGIGWTFLIVSFTSLHETMTIIVSTRCTFFPLCTTYYFAIHFVSLCKFKLSGARNTERLYHCSLLTSPTTTGEHHSLSYVQAVFIAYIDSVEGVTVIPHCLALRSWRRFRMHRH